MSAGVNNTSNYTTHNKIQLVKGGAEYFGFIKNLVDKATHSIFIRIYIWDDGETGTSIADMLITAAERKVEVYVIADGYASRGLSKAFRKRLTDNGIRFKYFEPLLRSSKFYFGRRMHEKIIVVDGMHALVGGINFADRYNDLHGINAWLDFALYVNGEAAYQLYKYCCNDWDLKWEKHLPPTSITKVDNICSVRVRRNDWVKGKNSVWHTYFHWFNIAENEIVIMCSYFIPGSVLRSRLGMAAKRGVKIKVILAGPSDVILAKYAERYLYTWMLKYGIEIYEYQPTVLHAKMMVVDNRLVTIGSFNVNNVSAYASLELNLDIRNKPFAASTSTVMKSIIEKDCVQITENNFKTNATFTKRLIQRTSYEIIRVILNLSTFYFKRE